MLQRQIARVEFSHPPISWLSVSNNKSIWQRTGSFRKEPSEACLASHSGADHGLVAAFRQTKWAAIGSHGTVAKTSIMGWT